MDTLNHKQPLLWHCLLWKDVRQIQPTLTAILIGAGVVQCVLLAMSAWVTDVQMLNALYGGIASLAFVAPILLAVGSSGMLIGQERQTGTWAWSTSLPVSWWQSLVSKLVIALVGSVAVGLLLAVIPLVLMLTQQLALTEAKAVGFAVLITLVVLIEVVVYSFLACLLIRETLTALVVAALLLTIGQGFLAMIVIGMLSEFSAGSVAMFHQVAEAASYAWTAGVMLIGLVAMILAFRRRWLDGSDTGIFGPWLSISGPLLTDGSPSSGGHLFTGVTAPSEWSMMLRHALANSWQLRLCVLCCGLLLLWNGINPFFTLVLAFLVGLLGLSAFEGDQSLQRLRCLTDRGVQPQLLVASRLLVAALFAGVTAGIPLCIVGLEYGVRLEIATAIAVSVCTFALGAFAAMCFRKPVIAATSAVVTCIVGVWTVAGMSAWLAFLGKGQHALDSLFEPAMIYWMIILASPPFALVVLTAMFGLARGWVIADRDRMPLHFVWVSIVAWAIPFVLFVGRLVTLI